MAALPRLLSAMLVACGKPAPPGPPADAGAAPEASSSASAEQPTVDAGRAELDAGREDSASTSARPAYPTEGIVPLAPRCKDARAILGVARYGDARLETGIVEVMRAHPEIEIVAGPPSVPAQIALWKTSYGGKVFSRESAPGSYAVLAHCFDPASCLALAAMVRAALPGSKPWLSCGDPPAISGGREALRDPRSTPAAPHLEHHVQDP